MGREDLHHNMEDTFDDTEIIKTGDLVAYDCAYRARASFFLDRRAFVGVEHWTTHWGEKTHFLLCAKDTETLTYYFFPLSFHMNSDGRQRVLLPRPHRMGARSV